MAKQAVAQLFSRTPIGGRRYSRSPTDTTPPSAPTLGAPVANTTLIDVAWVNGVDGDTGIKETAVEYRLNGATSWIEFFRVAYPGSSARITGLSTATPYDIRVRNYDNAGNVSAASAIQTVSTLGTSADLEPGLIAALATSLTVVENAAFAVQVSLTGAGVSSPGVRIDWSFSGFAEGTPSPANNFLQWAPGENGVKQIDVTAGNVLSNQNGVFRIVSVQALSGTINPSLGNTQTNITITNLSSAVYSLFDNFDGLVIDPAQWLIETDGGANTKEELSTDYALSGLKSKKSIITRDSAADFRAEVRDRLGPGSTTFGIDHWYGIAILIPPSWVASTGRDILLNWHTYSWLENPVETGTSPCIGLQIRGAVWEVIRRPNAGQPSGGATQESYTVNAGTYATGVWTRWVFRVRWHWASQGQLEVWKNDALVYQVLSGGNCANDRYAPYWKLGNYRVANKSGPGEPGVSPRIVYHDNARAIFSGGSYAAVRP